MTGSQDTGKLFYRIGEVSRLSGVKPHVLRYWEKEFRQIKPKKSGKGQRLYRSRDVDVILEIKRLLYDKRYTLSGAKKALKDAPPGSAKTGQDMDETPNLVKVIDELKNIRQMLKQK